MAEGFVDAASESCVALRGHGIYLRDLHPSLHLQHRDMPKLCVQIRHSGNYGAAVHHQLATLQFHQFLLCCPDQFRVIWNQVMIVQKFQVAHISAGRMRDTTGNEDKTWLK